MHPIFAVKALSGEPLVGAYLSMFLGAVFMAVLFAVAGLPWSVTVAPLLGRLRKKPLLALIIITGLLTIWAMGPGLGLVAFVDELALTEFLTRRAGRVPSSLLDILVPAFYLLGGLIAVFAFNHAFV